MQSSIFERVYKPLGRAIDFHLRKSYFDIPNVNWDHFPAVYQTFISRLILASYEIIITFHIDTSVDQLPADENKRFRNIVRVIIKVDATSLLNFGCEPT